MLLSHLRDEIKRVPNRQIYGRIAGVQGMLVELEGLKSYLSIGDRCHIEGRLHDVVCEVIGFRQGKALTLPYSGLDGIGPGSRVVLQGAQPVIHPHMGWLGRVINSFAEPVDGKGPLPEGDLAIPVRNQPPMAHSRKRVGEKIDLGVRVLNCFTTCCRGQRMGIFAGSGVGKSVLMGMLARYCEAEVIVIGLVGERGREVQEFLQTDLGAEGLARSVVVVATSDESALMRRDAAFITLSVAEYFRSLGKDVLLLMDSVTRFAMAQREIGLAVGEPPATRGYTPSVFAELPRLLERAGPDEGQGTITGLFTVLVEGDDQNEPIADAVRGILDGHIVLDRAIANRNRYPAVNVLSSVSRTMPACNSPAEVDVIAKAKKILTIYNDMAELIRLGAYRKGSDAATDEAIVYQPKLEQFMNQQKDDKSQIGEDFQQMAKLLDLDLNQIEKAKLAASNPNPNPNPALATPVKSSSPAPIASQAARPLNPPNQAVSRTLPSVNNAANQAGRVVPKNNQNQ